MNEGNKNIVFLNTLTGWIDKIASIVVNFVLKPIILSFLGTSMFGVMEMLNKMTDFMASADIRSATTVKWILSVERDKSSSDILNRKISAGFFSSLCTMPIYVVIGSILVYFAPIVTKVEPEYVNIVRVCMSLLATSFIITQILFIYEQVVQGMNIAYKRMGVRATITILGGFLTYFLLYLGYGLLGVVLSHLAVVITTGASYWFVVRKNLKWVSIHRVPFTEIWGFTKISIEFMIEKLLSVFSRSVDVIILGYFLTTTFVSQYSISSYVFQSLSGFVLMFMTAFITNISPLASKEDKSLLLDSRAQMWLLQAIIYSFLLILVLLYNRSFVSLWSSEDLYVGVVSNLLIVMYIITRCLAEVERSFLCMFLELKRVNKNAAISFVILIVVCITLVNLFGLNGLLLGLILSQMTNLFLNIRDFRKIIGANTLGTLKYLSLRFIIPIFLMMSCAYIIGDMIHINTWIVFLPVSMISSILLAATIYYACLNNDNKKIITKFKHMTKF